MTYKTHNLIHLLQRILMVIYDSILSYVEGFLVPFFWQDVWFRGYILYNYRQSLELFPIKCSFSFGPFCNQFFIIASQDYVTKLHSAQSFSVTFMYVVFDSYIWNFSVLPTFYSQKCKQYHWTGIILKQVNEDIDIKYFGNSSYYWMQYKKA